VHFSVLSTVILSTETQWFSGPSGIAFIHRSKLNLRQRHEILSFVTLTLKTASADCYEMNYYDCAIALLGTFAEFRK